jgi:hypothetical protein
VNNHAPRDSFPGSHRRAPNPSLRWQWSPDSETNTCCMAIDQARFFRVAVFFYVLEACCLFPSLNSQQPKRPAGVLLVAAILPLNESDLPSLAFSSTEAQENKRQAVQVTLSSRAFFLERSSFPHHQTPGTSRQLFAKKGANGTEPRRQASGGSTNEHSKTRQTETNATPEDTHQKHSHIQYNGAVYTWLSYNNNKNQDRSQRTYSLYICTATNDGVLEEDKYRHLLTRVITSASRRSMRHCRSCSPTSSSSRRRPM